MRQWKEICLQDTPPLKSVLNANREIIIGNDLIVYLDNEDQVIVKDDELKAAVREINISNPVKADFIEKVRDFGIGRGDEELTILSAHQINPHIEVSSGFNVNVFFDPCSRKVTLKDVWSSSLPLPCRVYQTQPPLSIQFNNNTPIVWNSSNTDYSAIWFGNQACDIHNPAKKIKSKSLTLAPFYSGVVNMKVWTTLWTTPKEYSLDLNNLGCTKESKVTFGTTLGNNGNDKLYSRLEVINSILTHRVVAESIFYKKKNNGNWDKTKTEISTKVTGEIKSANCGVTTNVDMEENWANSKSATITKGNGGSNTLYYSQFDSKHKAKGRNGQVIKTDLVLKVCN
jgi:hypothetical protein